MSTISNKSLAVFLTNPETLGLIAVYNGDSDNEVGTFYKTFDADIKVGDYINVPTKENRLGFTTNKVTEINVEPDLSSTQEVAWVVGRIDMAEYNRLLENEKQLTIELNRIEREKARAQMAEDMIGGIDKKSMKVIQNLSK